MPDPEVKSDTGPRRKHKTPESRGSSYRIAGPWTGNRFQATIDPRPRD